MSQENEVRSVQEIRMRASVRYLLQKNTLSASGVSYLFVILKAHRDMTQHFVDVFHVDIPANGKYIFMSIYAKRFL